MARRNTKAKRDRLWERREKHKGSIPEPKGTLLSFIPTTRMEITSNQEALIDGCKGILSYDENLVQILGDKWLLSFEGSNLQIRSLSEQTVMVAGEIRSIHFT